MARTFKPDDLATIKARRDVLEAELAELDRRAKAAQLAARNAGRAILVDLPTRSHPARDEGVKLVISDAHEGLKAAITHVVGVTWQRCRVNFMCNALRTCPKAKIP